MTWQWLTDFDWVVYDGEALEALEKAYLDQENVLDLGKAEFSLKGDLLNRLFQKVLYCRLGFLKKYF